jgi:hypothetical protein
MKYKQKSKNKKDKNKHKMSYFKIPLPNFLLKKLKFYQTKRCDKQMRHGILGQKLRYDRRVK